MLLEVDGLTMPDKMKLHAFTDTPPPGTWGGQRPRHLIKLGRSLWPVNIKQAIIKIYQAHGLPDPAKQKLVEPIARVFGGREHEGVLDLSKVNWELVVDYFIWEVEAIMGTGKPEKLQKRAKKKYGGIFSHYQVYERPYDNSRVHAEI